MSETPRTKMEAETERLIDLIEAGLPASESDGMNEFERAAWKLCDKVRTLVRELGEVKRDADNCRQIIDTYSRQEADLQKLQQELSQANERISILEKECQQNNQAACLFDRDAALAELARVRGELDKWKDGCLSNADLYKEACRLSDSRRLDNLKLSEERDLLAKRNHKMREALTTFAHVSYLPSRDGTKKLPTYGQMVKSLADEALTSSDLSSLTVLNKSVLQAASDQIDFDQENKCAVCHCCGMELDDKGKGHKSDCLADLILSNQHENS